MDYVVLDLEFNNMQQRSMENSMLNRDRPNRQIYPNEIIQIGAVRLSPSFKEKKELNLFVKGVQFQRLNPLISEMTGIRQEDVDGGIPYKEAFQKLEKFCKKAMIVTWGISDIYEILRNNHMHELGFRKIGTSYLDLQDLIGRGRDQSTPSLKSILEEFKIPVNEDKLHDGLYDAKSTGWVLEAYAHTKGQLPKGYDTRLLFCKDALRVKNIHLRDVPDEFVTMKCPLCQGAINYDISMSQDRQGISAYYHCQDCGKAFQEQISARENMNRERKYFKRIRTLSPLIFKSVVNQRKRNRSQY